MKVAIVFNRESRNVINIFGTPNQEKIGMKTITRLANALKQGGHQVTAIEGDKDLISRLEEFMPRVVKHERPGMVFNVSYGIQGQARYTHVPSILEMVGIPYVASGPLAHSLALDKVVTKMILRQHGLPTPEFAVVDSVDTPVEGLKYPLIVKPKNEAVSFGLRVVNSDEELREGVRVILDKYRQPVLVERFISGREVNVGILGNAPPEALPPVELNFGTEGPAIYTYEDKTGRSGRSITHTCPAPISPELDQRSRELSVKAFQALGCYDCARVDMRLDADNNLYILEINSLPSLGEHGSYLIGAQAVGLDFTAFINRLVEVASARYFGTPSPPRVEASSQDPSARAVSFITQRRDEMEGSVRDWSRQASRSMDPIGIQHAGVRLDRTFGDLGLTRVDELTNWSSTWMWQTAAGLDNGTLFIGNLDVPIEVEMPRQPFRRDPEWLYGEGIGSSRAPLVMLQYALRSLRGLRRLRRTPIGVLYYADEGIGGRHSAAAIRKAARRAARVIVLRPGNPGDIVITKRRGHRRYRLRVEGDSVRPGRLSKKPDTLRWTTSRLEKIAELTSAPGRVSVSTLDLATERMSMRLPHIVTGTIIMTYPKAEKANETEQRMRDILGRGGPHWELELDSDRPPMNETPETLGLYRQFAEVAADLEIPLKRDSSTWPSAGGLIPEGIPVLCGVGPVARELRTPNESVQRISLIQRTLVLAEFLARRLESVQ